MEQVRTSRGVSDITDGNTTRFAEEICRRSGEIHALALIKSFKHALAQEEVGREEFNSRTLWPIPFARTMKHANDAFEGNLIKICKVMREKFYLYTCKAWSKLYSRYAGEKIRISSLDCFIKESSQAVRRAIADGKQAVISRVLETKLNWTIGPLVEDLRKARRNKKTPECMFFLSPNSDPEYGLIEIGYREAAHLNEHPEKRMNLTPDRGISWIPDANALRHVRLHARTMAGLFFVKKIFPVHTRVFFRNQFPDARCNIIHDGERVLDAFQVQLEGYAIGLDSAFYRVLDPSYAYTLYEHTIDRQKRMELDKDRILSEIEKSSKIESRIVEKNNWVEVENTIADEENLSLPPWTRKSEVRRLRSYTIEDMLDQVNQAMEKADGRNVRKILRILSNEQVIIDEKFMPKLRQIFEQREN